MMPRSMEFREREREITGEAPPPTPVSARTYAEYGLPRCELYGDGLGAVAASGVLAGVKLVEHDAALGPVSRGAPDGGRGDPDTTAVRSHCRGPWARVPCGRHETGRATAIHDVDRALQRG